MAKLREFFVAIDCTDISVVFAIDCKKYLKVSNGNFREITLNSHRYWSR